MRARASYPLLVIVVLTLLAFSHRAPAQVAAAETATSDRKATAPTIHWEEIASRADQHAARYEQLGRFSGAVLISKGSKILLAKGYGLADREKGIANTPDTVFRLGSLTKQFTAAGIMKLVAEGELRTDDKLSQHLPGYPRETADKITIEQLLTHSSGIPSLGRRGDGLDDVNGVAAERSIQKQIALFENKELLFEPGARYRYNNSGYVVLAAVIENVSGKTFRSFLQEKILEPLGIQPSHQRVELHAKGYTGYPPTIQRGADVHPDWLLGASGWSASVRDLHLWVEGLRRGTVLPAAQRDALFAPHIACAPKLSYGYGWFVEPRAEWTLVFHGGTEESGFVSELYMLPEQELTVVVTANYLPTLGVNAPARIAEAVIGMVLGEPVEEIPTILARPDEKARVAGTYRSASGLELVVTQTGDELWATVKGKDVDSVFDVGELPLSARPDSIRETAERAAEHVRHGDIKELRRLMNGTVKSYMTGEAIMQMNERLVAQFGESFELRVAGVKRFPGKAKFFVPLRASGGASEPTDIAFDIGSDGLISGVYGMTPSESDALLADKPPKAVRLWPTGENRYFVDGFLFRENSLQCEIERDDSGAADTLILTGTQTHRFRRLRG